MSSSYRPGLASIALSETRVRDFVLVRTLASPIGVPGHSTAAGSAGAGNVNSSRSTVAILCSPLWLVSPGPSSSANQRPTAASRRLTTDVWLDRGWDSGTGAVG